MKRYCLLLLAVVLWSCGGEITKEDALSRVSSLAEYQTSFYAPMHVGRQVLTGENHKNSKGYIAKKYGSLVEQGLLEVEVKEDNAWRTVVELSVSEKGKGYLDPRRSDADHAYVAVCRVLPVQVDTLIVHSKDSVECKYVIQQSDITPFGEHLGFEDGLTYNVTAWLTE